MSFHRTHEIIRGGSCIRHLNLQLFLFRWNPALTSLSVSLLLSPLQTLRRPRAFFSRMLVSLARRMHLLIESRPFTMSDDFATGAVSFEDSSAFRMSLDSVVRLLRSKARHGIDFGGRLAAL